MRIPSNKPPVIDPPKPRDKRGVESPARPGESAPAPHAAAAVPSPSLDRVAQDAYVASHEFEQTIAARLDQVKEQIRGGTYQVDYERLAQRLMEEGLGS